MIRPCIESKYVSLAARLLAALACALLLGCGGVTESGPADDAAAAEEPLATGYIELYTDKKSYLPGEAVEIHVSTSAPTFTLDILRDGWTQTSMAQLGTFVGTLNAIPPAAQEPWRTGAGWPVTFTWTVPSAWLSGSYLVRARTTSGPAASSLHPFILRSAAPGSRSRVAFLMNFNTRNAYNQWGGKSLYVSKVPGDTQPANVVSFQRPMPGLGACYPGQKAVSSQLDADGFAPEFLTEWDVHANPAVLQSYDVVVLACHHEYISEPVYQALLDHHARGGDLAFFSADDIVWQVRYELSGTTMVGYRTRALKQDPLKGVNDALVTTRWAGPLLNRPPARLQGVAFESSSDDFEGADYIVQNSSHWIFAGTGVHDGDAFGNRMATGETDYSTADSPPVMDSLLKGLRVTELPGHIAPVSSVRALSIYYADNASYGFPNGNGGQVFSSGTTRGWGDSLKDASPGHDAVRQAMRNIVRHMLDN